MSQLFDVFPKPTYEQWVEKLKKDLKNEPETLIQRNDAIEELNFNSYQHVDSGKTTPVKALLNKYVSQTYKANNDWDNIANIIVTDEQTANSEALTALNLGATALRFEIKKSVINWNRLLEGIQLPYIHTTIKISQANQIAEVRTILDEASKASVFFELDIVTNNFKVDATTIQLLKDTQFPALIANGYNIQQAGATTWQEIAFSLSVAHEAFVQLLENGLTVDQAAATIHFNIGVGANYFYEIAKVRALRILWARIIEEYQPEHACSYNTKITGIVGFVNKSLKDPHTNLLRQTTETMSLAIAGVDGICVQPYDCNSEKGASKLTKRMAINISTILKEESFLDKVQEPLAGSYAVEYLTQSIADKAWELFQHLDEQGGIASNKAQQFLREQIAAKANLRKKRVQEKADALIGINIFPNPQTETNTWSSFDDYFELSQLILEQSI
ncbi:MAG TPA: methylmalonyl-CoA mutase family protein [Taishania sp.]|nr:methylmalonyl-CoA mutase family protein [Taishania sp.]